MKQANQVATYINAIASHIKAGKTLKQALEALTPVFDKASVEDQQAITLQIAQFIGKEYGVKPITTNRGGVSFDRKTKKGDAARKMLTYYFPTVAVSKAKPKVSKQVDVVAISRRKAEKFAEVHKAVEIKAEIEAVKAYLKSLQAYL